MKSLMTMLERFPLTVKLALGFAALMLVALTLGLHSLYTQRKLTQEIQLLYDKELLGISHIKEARIHYAIIGRAVRQYLLALDAVERDRALRQLLESETAVREELGEAEQRILREENRTKLAKFNELFANYKQNIDKVIVMSQTGRLSDALAFVGTAEFQQDGIAANEALAQVAQFKENSAREEEQRAKLLSEKGTRITVLLLIVGVGAGMFFGLLITVSIRRPTERIRETVEQLAAGKLDCPVPHADYPNEIGDLARSIEVLRDESKKLEGERWLKTHIAAITNELQSTGSFSELAQKLFSSVAPLIRLGHGVFYIYDEDQQKLRLLCGYAHSERKNLDQYFALGQGLVGQCALEGTPIYISQPPADYIRISSGMGTAVPKMIAVIPVLNGKRLLAVIELATYELFNEKEQALLDALMPILAMSLDILDRNAKTQRLLEETQRQAEGMERQAAHLEEQTVELEAQQASLRETTDYLVEQRAAMQQILDHSPVGTAFTTKGIFRYTNPEFEKMFDCRPGDSAARIYATPEDREKMIEDIKRDGFVRDREMTMVGSGGQLREYLVTFMPFKHEGEEGVMGWLLDISDRKREENNEAPSALDKIEEITL